jgi:integrase
MHDLYRTLEQRGGRAGAPLSRTTVRIVHRVLMKAFKDLGLQLDGVRTPREAQRDTMGRKGVWAPAECVQFLDHHQPHRLRAAWVLAIVVGVRRGELAGLRWSRVDLDKGILFIHWQRVATSAGVLEKEPKGKSRRAVALGPAVVAELRAHRVRQDAERAEAGVVYRDGDYVFCREDGLPYYPKYFTDQWADACADAKVAVISLHDARHTSATSGADAGVPEHVMQRRLGHADARTTREVYTHALPEGNLADRSGLDHGVDDRSTGPRRPSVSHRREGRAAPARGSNRLTDPTPHHLQGTRSKPAPKPAAHTCPRPEPGRTPPNGDQLTSASGATARPGVVDIGVSKVVLAGNVIRAVQAACCVRMIDPRAQGPRPRCDRVLLRLSDENFAGMINNLLVTIHVERDGRVATATHGRRARMIERPSA